MNEFIESLRKNRYETKSLIEEVSKEFHEIEGKLNKLRSEYDAWDVALRLALEKAGKPIFTEEEAPIPKEAGTKGLRKGSIPDLCRRVLSQKEPLTPDELLKELEFMAKKVSIVSIIGALHRYSPKVFNRNDDGKWYLETQERSGSEEIQAASE